MLLALQPYRDRAAAGRALGPQLARFANRRDTVVLALPRDGVPVALEVATYLGAPLDVMSVRPLLLRRDPDWAIGAVTSGGTRLLDDLAIEQADVPAPLVQQLTAREQAKLERLDTSYRGRRRRAEIADRIVILVDDGLGPGSLIHSAVIALHQQRPAWLVVAVPVGSEEACAELAAEVHEVVCPLKPEPFDSAGLWYEHAAPTTDEMVCRCMRQAATRPLL